MPLNANTSEILVWDFGESPIRPSKVAGFQAFPLGLPTSVRGEATSDVRSGGKQGEDWFAVPKAESPLLSSIAFGKAPRRET
eukprot:CAMPEP_0174355642 /NCGR_PEP_ID=MMETSP0811_2-20130205/25733_1 /TAXON_ID=73025 ORGANISM="Eutreptiella gymnastica-like, Strain CCMP1594" /NCGR_SAMPLE_ID=MMETSP0811_2 /ASSEMBLY_ACC=CAM_ASM_000667 /LENGTH=81 /DNA_ID=CAMNT_0015487077 /DNA_START=997 /DNA_END=1240 /DNA_ORIENTATION=-